MFITAFCFAAAGMLLAFGDEAKDGVRDGLLMCSNILVPSLFPFMALCCFFCESGAADRVGRFLSPMLRIILGRLGGFGDIVLISFVGGYPAAAVAARSLCSKKCIDEKTAGVLLLFAVNPSPAFAITAVGRCLLKSAELGVIIYFSCVLSSLIMGSVIGHVFKGVGPRNGSIRSESEVGITDAFVNGTASASRAMLCICSTVTAFSGFMPLIFHVFQSSELKTALRACLEITSASVSLSGKVTLPVLTSIIAFGGICTGIQVLASAEGIFKKPVYFWISRIVHGLLAGAISHLICLLFPVAVSTVSNGKEILFPGYSVSPIASASLVLTAVIFLCSLERGSTNEKQGVYKR